MRFGKSLFRQYKPRSKAKKSKARMVKCPNCGQKTVKDESNSCQWCRYPLK